MTASRWRALRWRLTAAFVAVAVAAVAIVAGLAAWSASGRVGQLLDRRHAVITQEIVGALTDSYRQAGGWAGADLSAAQALAAAAGAQLSLITPIGAAAGTARNSVLRAGPSSSAGPSAAGPGGAGPGSGQTDPGPGVARTPTPVRSQVSAGTPTGDASGVGQTPAAADPGSSGPGPVRSGQPSTSATDPRTPAPGPSSGPAATGRPITIGGAVVGFAVVHFPSASSSAENQARSAILQTIGGSAALAVLVAVVIGLLASRRISRPVGQLVAATRAVGDGAGPSLPTRAPGELGELARSFGQMAERLALTESARRALVADVAHELRTPVTILRGATEELVDGIVAPDPQRLASLHDEVLRLGRIVDDLAALAAADAAGLHVASVPLDLATVVEQAVELIGPRAADAGLTVKTRLASGPVRGDPARLEQVVANLLTNAVKFTPSGGRIELATHRDGPDVVLEVHDSGPGIPADELPYVFQRFWRGRGAAQHSGSGVGLAVVERLVTAHGGVVTAESPPGSGAHFLVRLPADDRP